MYSENQQHNSMDRMHNIIVHTMTVMIASNLCIIIIYNIIIEYKLLLACIVCNSYSFMLKQDSVVFL